MWLIHYHYLLHLIDPLLYLQSHFFGTVKLEVQLLLQLLSISAYRLYLSPSNKPINSFDINLELVFEESEIGYLREHVNELLDLPLLFIDFYPF